MQSDINDVLEPLSKGDKRPPMQRPPVAAAELPRGASLDVYLQQLGADVIVTVYVRPIGMNICPQLIGAEKQISRNLPHMKPWQLDEALRQLFRKCGLSEIAKPRPLADGPLPKDVYPHAFSPMQKETLYRLLEPYAGKVL